MNRRWGWRRLSFSRFSTPSSSCASKDDDLLVEQNANQALKLADRGYVLENGHVVLEDTGDALLANEAVRSAYLGG